ncbi:MAG: SPOR domain-containing protein, partial [Sulfitobacter sp.]
EPAPAQATTQATVQAAPEVNAAPLDPITTAASTAIETAPAPQPKPAAPVQSSKLSKPFIQIGIFSIEANAERAAKQMRGAGLSPTIKLSKINGKTFWRVVVGPAATSAERSKILSTIKSEGFTDAYAVSS